MAKTTLKFSSVLAPTDPKNHPVIFISQLKNYGRIEFKQVAPKFASKISEETFNQAVNQLHPSPVDSCYFYLNVLQVAALPVKSSRHNTPSRSHAITKLVRQFITGTDQSVVLICERAEAFAAGCAVARAFPRFTRKTIGTIPSPTVSVEFILVGDYLQPLTERELECIAHAGESIRLAAKIVDMPCSEMNVDAFLDEVRKVGTDLGIAPYIVQGEELNAKGFGGIYSVGKAASCPPALAVLSYKPEGASETIAWVGKGIVYDTGGLSIKSKTGMPGMKRDCGGAAAILGAFHTAVKMGFKENLHAVFCLAENAVGPLSTRPDDIITLYSGRTVEVNNTDAEGRLVLGDGVAYALRDLNANVILDMCTLTSAQGIATGKLHSSILTNQEQWEQFIVSAGRTTGDLAHPLPYCPEMHFSEFSSAVADMKNSVADRSNALSSCAGLFVMAHIGFDYPGVWIHVDMASPVHCGERGTGYGVALLLGLFGHYSQNSLLQSISPKNQQINEVCASKKMRLA